MTTNDVIALLCQECEFVGGGSAWAKMNGVSAQYVTDVRQGRREPGPVIYKALGLERVVSFKRVAVDQA